MTSDKARSLTPPAFSRPDAEAIYASHWYVPDEQDGNAILDRIIAVWEEARWPPGILTFSAYLSCDGRTALTYAQCRRSDVYRPFVQALPDPATRIEPIEYRRHSSLTLGDGQGVPSAVVAASFDVDGPERQRHIIAMVSGRLRAAPAEHYTGLIASHFHTSLDGSRVINFAEWVSDEAHLVFMGGSAQHGTLRLVTETPGVRPIGFTRYHLRHSLTR